MCDQQSIRSACAYVQSDQSLASRLSILRLLNLNAPIATKVICFSRLLKCLRGLYGKQYGPRSDDSYRSSLFWVHTVCFCTQFVSNARQLFAADDSSRRHFQMHFFLGALRVKLLIEHHLEFVSLKGGCRGSSESTHVKMPHCWKSHALAHISWFFQPVIQQQDDDDEDYTPLRLPGTGKPVLSSH